MSPPISSGVLYELRGAAISSKEKKIIEGVSLSFFERRLTVILGPAGVGKSSLLAALAERSQPELRLLGDWSRPAASQVFYLPQKSTTHTFRDALSSGAKVLLLDEPNQRSSPEELKRGLREHCQQGSAIVVTHDLSFAKEVADEVCLLCMGCVFWSGAAQDFFTKPQHRLVTRFIEQGNCWPGPCGLALPSHFRWLLPGRLAGMGWPGLLNDVEEDLSALSGAGVTQLISLTEEPFPASTLKPYGILSRHFPIPDMGVPSLNVGANICREMERSIKGGGLVVVHCRAGLGRTGTLLAAFLVWQGEAPEAALSRLFSINKGFVQSARQREFVYRFAAEFPPRR